MDARGYLVAEFAAESLSELRRGDLHAYMNRFIGHGTAGATPPPHYPCGAPTPAPSARLVAPEADPTQPGLRRVQARRRLTSPKTAAPSSATTRHNGLATEFGLTRDPARWGAPGVGTRQGAVHAESEAALLYALRPPWVANDPLAAERQRAAAARANRDRPRSATEVDAPPEEHAFVLGTAGFK